MRSIRDFGRSEQNDGGAINEELQSVAAKYSGKSEGELIAALRQNVAEAKRNGSFSAEQLDSFVSFVSSSLDGPSRQRLNELVEMIKSQ